jgi:hypothetical protein
VNGFGGFAILMALAFGLLLVLCYVAFFLAQMKLFRVASLLEEILIELRKRS